MGRSRTGQLNLGCALTNMSLLASSDSLFGVGEQQDGTTISSVNTDTSAVDSRAVVESATTLEINLEEMVNIINFYLADFHILCLQVELFTAHLGLGFALGAMVVVFIMTLLFWVALACKRASCPRLTSLA